jgi:hypothetical protein
LKPITYWVQNDVINRLVDDYGSTFEQLPAASKRHLIACLASEIHYWEGENKEVDWTYAKTEQLTRHEKDLLIEAIAATLTHQGNPWVDNARKNVAIEQAQKTGTPSH